MHEAPTEAERLAVHDVLRLRADNGGPLTLSGTNTWVVGRNPAWVVDPGPALQAHVGELLQAIEARGGLGGVALTHDHADHAEALGALLHAHPAPVAGGRGARDVTLAEDVRFGPFLAVATPGHARDHFALLAHDACFTGDAVLGEGSVFVAAYPGAMAAYLDALARLARRGGFAVLCPGHGPPVWDAQGKLAQIIDHRMQRERALLAALQRGLRSEDSCWTPSGRTRPPRCAPSPPSRSPRTWTSSARKGACPRECRRRRSRAGRAKSIGERRQLPFSAAMTDKDPPPPSTAGIDPWSRAGGAPHVTPALASATSMDSSFPAIGDYGFLSDCHTGALVASDGSIEWMCLPHFDSPSLFGALLDRSAGSFRVGPYGLYVPAGRRYIPGTNMIETTWMTPQGWLYVVDALTIGAWHDNKRDSSHTRPPTDFDADHLLVRVIRCIQGEVQVEMLCEPMIDYGSTAPTWSAVDTGPEGGEALDASAGETSVRLFSDMRMGIEGNSVRSRHTMSEGEICYCALSWTEEHAGPRTGEQAEEYLKSTARFWRSWLAEGTYPDHPWRVYLQRSALTLKGLTFMPTGALVAAPTTSLPETPGGERNWDYRYCWMRDASFTLWGLHALGLDWEADDFIQYVADLQRNEDGSLQIMYGIKGQKELPESTLDQLKGYAGARPVRIGNAAYNQRQNDVYGAVLDSVYLHSKRRDHIPDRMWPVLSDQVHCAAKVWKQPDQGIWETRGEPRHYVSSKLMCWVAMDRGARLAERRSEQARARRWQSLADEIHKDVCKRGVDGRGVFRQHYDTDALDASTLLVPLLRFLPPDDERVRATVFAIRDELTENGLVMRYRTDQTDDGLHGKEGTFLLCSFWLVSALSEIGEAQEAEHLCERLLSFASPMELYGEELEASSGRHLGNYPQAFTHLALINAVTHVVAAKQS